MRSWLAGPLAICTFIAIEAGCSREETEAADYSEESQAHNPFFSDEVAIESIDDGKKAELELLSDFCASPSSEKQSNKMRLAFATSSSGFRYLELGKVESSTITKPLLGDMYGEGWVFFLCDTEEHVTIEMTSFSIDPQMVLIKGLVQGSTEIVAENDDSEESLNAEISIRLSRGIYQIAALANPEVRGNTGTYFLLADKR